MTEPKPLTEKWWDDAILGTEDAVRRRIPPNEPVVEWFQVLRRELDARDARIAELAYESVNLRTERDGRDRRIRELESGYQALSQMMRARNDRISTLRDTLFARDARIKELGRERDRVMSISVGKGERVRELEAEVKTLREAGEHGVYFIACPKHRRILTVDKRMPCPVCELEASACRWPGPESCVDLIHSLRLQLAEVTQP